MTIWNGLRARLRELFSHPHSAPLMAVILVAIASLPTLRFVYHRMHTVRGWEADSIAKSIVSGFGFSFPGTDRWLWEKWKGDPNSYFPTAWVDPVFTYVLAGAHWAFGNYAYIAMYACAFLCLGVMYVCVYRTAMRFGGEWVGVLAVVLLAANLDLGRSFFEDITNSALSAMVIAATALVSTRYFEQPTRRRLIEMGFVVGFTVLTCPATFYYPLLLIVALALVHRRNYTTTAAHAAIMLACVAVVLAPWTIRNYVTFGEFIPVRNGGGQIAWDGTVGPAETFMPGTAQSPVPAPWRSDGPYEAIQNMMKKELRIPIHRYQVQSLAAADVPGYHEMNEAERDELSMSRAIEFVRENPVVATQMAFIKLWVYCTRFGMYGLIVLAIAVAVALSALRDRRTWPLTALAITYSLPFALMIAYFGRYRAPIEPVLSILAAGGIWVWLKSRWGLKFREVFASVFTPTPELSKSQS